MVHVEAHEKMQQVHRKRVAPRKDSEVLEHRRCFHGKRHENSGGSGMRRAGRATQCLMADPGLSELFPCSLGISREK